jgi:DNA adenine methylase
MRFVSPLRYPGGKGKIADYFQLLMTQNFLCGGQYVEPFAGGSSIALTLLFNEFVSHIHINDYDYAIYCFWHSILNNPEDLSKKIHDAKLDVEEWKKQKHINQHTEENCILDIGFSTFYLNRTNISGIIKGGVIGGLQQSGKWKIDARFNKYELIERVKRIALYSKRIKLYNEDAINLLPELSKKLPSNSFIYIDPPYYKKGRELYVNFYKNTDHVKLSKVIKNIKNVGWLISYDNIKNIREMYSEFRQLDFSINYHAGKSTKGSEVFIFSNDLIIPEAVCPTNRINKIFIT